MANVIIKNDKRRTQEAAVLRCFGGGVSGNSEHQNHEFAEEISARMDEIKREVGIGK